MDEFKYQSLQSGEIRLLDLLSDGSARMRSVALKDQHRRHKYIALSYTWGEDTNTFPFMCNRQNLPVRANLLLALSHLKDIIDMPIWIDAMCINQSDEVEKIGQIQMMTEIYRGAEKVLIWLGEEVPEVQVATSQLHSVTASLKSQKPAEIEVDMILKPSFIMGVRYLMTRPWWPRLWVLQEATLAREAVFVCGTQVIHWNHLHALAKQISRLNLYETFRGHSGRPEYCDGFNEILNIRGVQSTHSATLATDLVRICRQRMCFDPCDRVYGVIGLMPEHVRDGFTWEPGETVEDLYPPFVHILLHMDITALLLSLTDTTERNPKLPSWCPDLHYRSIPNVLADHEGYHAGYGIQTTTDLDWEQTKRDWKIVQIKGIVVDRVKTVESTYWADAAAGDLENIAILQEYVPIAERHIPGTEIWRFFIGNMLGKEDSKLHWLAGFTSIHDRLAARRWKSEEAVYRNAFEELKVYSSDAGEASKADQLYLTKARNICLGRRLFTTEGGRIGFGPASTTAGDVVCIMKCVKVPFVLHRKDTVDECFELKGEAYIHGLMYGEYLKSKKKFGWITLV